MAHPVAQTFLDAAGLLERDELRDGNCLNFTAEDEIVYVGDIHGHRQNLAKVIARSDLAGHPRRRLVLQEVIHGGPTDAEGADRSVEVLLRAARLKVTSPQRVFFLMGNHDLAQLTGNEITKDGRGVCQAFEAGLEHSFGPAAGQVRSAVYAMLEAMPLAGRCPNGMFLSHSLPSPARMGLIDWEILRRPYRPDDLRRGGSVYEWVWGRQHTPEQLAELAERLGATQFLLGHQPVETGWRIEHERLVLLASDHGHGAVMVFDAGQAVANDRLGDLIRPIAAL